MKRWYVVFSKPRQERRAQENLERQGYTTYLPRILDVRRRAGRRVPVVAPLFPRYVFIHLDNLSDNWFPIRSTFGVTSMVRVGHAPALVPEEIVAGIRSREQEDGLHRGPSTEPARGERVQIVEGSMAGLEGIFSARTGQQRVVILLELLGRQVPVQVDYHAVELSR